MRNASKIITGLALAGLAVAGGAAFTAPGLANNVDTSSAFVGGQVGTTVSGAVLEDIDFTQAPVLNDLSQITKVTLTFDALTPAGSQANIRFSNAGNTLVDSIVWPTDVAVDGTTHKAEFLAPGSPTTGESIFNGITLVVTVTPKDDAAATGTPTPYQNLLTSAAPTSVG